MCNILKLMSLVFVASILMNECGTNSIYADMRGVDKQKFIDRLIDKSCNSQQVPSSREFGCVLDMMSMYGITKEEMVTYLRNAIDDCNQVSNSTEYFGDIDENLHMYNCEAHFDLMRHLKSYD